MNPAPGYCYWRIHAGYCIDINSRIPMRVVFSIDHLHHVSWLKCVNTNTANTEIESTTASDAICFSHRSQRPVNAALCLSWNQWLMDIETLYAPREVPSKAGQPHWRCCCCSYAINRSLWSFGGALLCTEEAISHSNARFGRLFLGCWAECRRNESLSPPMTKFQWLIVGLLAGTVEGIVWSKKKADCLGLSAVWSVWMARFDLHRAAASTAMMSSHIDWVTDRWINIGASH